MTQVDSSSSSALPADSIHLRWSWIAVVSTILMLLSLGALVLVATLQKVDALATIALALAVLSFVIQIGLFVADAWQRSQSETRANQVNIESKSLLAEMKETSRATNELLNRQFDTVLKSLIDATERTVADTKGNDSDLRDRLDRELRRVISGGPAPYAKQNDTAEDRAILSQYSVPLDGEELAQVRTQIAELSGPAITGLAKLARDDVATRSGEGGAHGFFESMIPGIKDLQEHGLIETVEAPERLRRANPSDEQFYVLTAPGRVAARFLEGASTDQD